MWKLLLIALLAVVAEGRRVKTTLKLNGSTPGYYHPLKIHSKFLPKDSENTLLMLETTGTLGSVPLYSQEETIIPDNVKTHSSVIGINSVKENQTNETHNEIRISQTARDINGSELVKNNEPVGGKDSNSLIDSVLGYFNFGVQNNNDLKIDPEFEHLPEVDYPDIDPEFEHQPNTKPNSAEYWLNYFPTWEDGSETSSESLNEINLQRSQVSNMAERTIDRMNTSDEDYYFDSDVNQTQSMSIGIYHEKVITHKTTDLRTTEQNDTAEMYSTPSSPVNTNLARNSVETSNGDIEYDYSFGNDLIHHSLKNEFFDNIDDKFRSLVFNPVAGPHEKFQECKTPRNETGHCRYVQHCFLPNIIVSLGNFMRYVCIIQERFIGICCPEFPVHSVEVDWKLPANELHLDSAENITQPEGGCGISSKTRIVGGSKADPKEWPWMAALLSKTRGNFFCGGALINSKYVLTAAHCTFRVPENQILVRLGEYDFSDSNDGPGEDYPVVEMKRHALYSRKTLKNDIALLKLGRPAKYDQFVSTICLPENKERYVGRMATLAGWGNIKGGGPTSKVLLEASFPVWSNAKCSEVQGIPIRSIFMCAGSREEGKGACNGDSGGPLMLLDEQTKLWKAIGLVSWGRRGCDTKYPTVFTRVSSYLKWIEAHSSD